MVDKMSGHFSVSLPIRRSNSDENRAFLTDGEFEPWRLRLVSGSESRRPGEPAVVQVGEAAAAGDQVVGGAGLDHVAVLDDGDLVGVDHRGQPVGDDDGGAALAQAAQGLLQAGLGDHVQVRGGLVEDEQGGVGDPGAGERDELALAGGQLDAAFADLGVEALGQGVGHGFGADGADGGLDLGAGGVGTAEADVVGDGRWPSTVKGGEQERDRRVRRGRGTAAPAGPGRSRAPRRPLARRCTPGARWR